MLNYCVRYGNRWNHPGIITGYVKELLFFQNYTEENAMLDILVTEHIGAQNRFAILRKRFAQFCASLRSFKIGSLLKISCRLISTGQLHALRRFHTLPINLVFFKESKILHLGTGFTLRCFQRLSLPDAATRLCRWRDNRFTGGPSTPVLSY